MSLGCVCLLVGKDIDEREVPGINGFGSGVCQIKFPKKRNGGSGKAEELIKGGKRESGKFSRVRKAGSRNWRDMRECGSGTGHNPGRGCKDFTRE
jgi:hypothetical protein